MTRRIIYLIVFLVWLVVMAFPFVTFKLATEDEFTIGNTRIFLITERRQAGVGFHTEKPASNDPVCQRTSIRYVMWKGEADNLQSCYCTDGSERELQGRQCVVP